MPGNTMERVLAESSDSANPDPDAIGELLRTVQQVAVVGMSRDPAKAARRVPSYLATKGYSIIPVNPHADRILGREAAGSLAEVEEAVDLVLIFRPSEDAGEVVRQALERPERPAIWLQEGIRADEEVARARRAGRTVIQDLCIFKAHRGLPEAPLRAAERG